MSDHVILAGASVRSLAEVCVRRGLRPRCFDMFCDTDLRALMAEAGTAAPVRIETYDELPSRLKDIEGCVPMVWCGGLENHVGLLKHPEISRRLCGTPPERLRAVSPEKLALLTAGTAVCVPEGQFAGSAGFGRRRGRWLAKPAAGSGGVGIREAHSGEKPNDGVFLQKHVSGASISALFHASPGSGRAEFLVASRQLVGLASCGAPPFAFCGNRGPIRLPHAVRTVLETVACRAAAAGIQGVFGMDCIVRGRDVWLIEINPRITAAHEQYDAMQDATSTIELQMQIQSTAAAVRKDCAASCLTRLVLYSRRSFVLSGEDVERLLTFRRAPEGPAVPAGRRTVRMADIPPPGPITAGQPFCSIYVLEASGRGGGSGEAACGLSELLSAAAGYTGLCAKQLQSEIDSTADPFSG